MRTTTTTTRRTITTTTLLALCAVLAPAPSATAAPAAQPTRKQIVQWCNKDSANCTFVPDSAPVRFIGEKKQLTGRTSNCTSENSSTTLTDATTDSTSDNVGGSVTAGASFEIFEVGFTASYNKTWQQSRTVTIARGFNLKPGEIGWFERGAALQKVTGKFVFRQAKPVEGAHFWFAEDVTITGPDPEGGDGDIIAKSRPMTDTELRTHCA